MVIVNHKVKVAMVKQCYPTSEFPEIEKSWVLSVLMSWPEKVQDLIIMSHWRNNKYTPNSTLLGAIMENDPPRMVFHNSSLGNRGYKGNVKENDATREASETLLIAPKKHS